MRTVNKTPTSTGRRDDRRNAGLGTFGGVFTPSILTILGIILFRRLGFIVGSGGLAQALVMLGVANAHLGPHEHLTISHRDEPKGQGGRRLLPDLQNARGLNTVGLSASSCSPLRRSRWRSTVLGSGRASATLVGGAEWVHPGLCGARRRRTAWPGVLRCRPRDAIPIRHHAES